MFLAGTHSVRKASIGLTRAALRAGSQLARSATAVSTASTDAMVVASSGATPNSRLERLRVNTSAPTMPSSYQNSNRAVVGAFSGRSPTRRPRRAVSKPWPVIRRTGSLVTTFCQLFRDSTAGARGPRIAAPTGRARKGSSGATAAGAAAGAGAGAGAGAATQTTAAQGTASTAAEADDDDDDRNDLARMALAGVAGLVVGQMLSNNRQVALNTGDRVIVTRPDGSQEVIKNDNALLLRPGSTVQTENFADGSSRTSVLREDGSRVVTIRDADLRVLRRSLVRADGTVTTLIDDTVEVEPVDVADLPPPARPVLDTTRPFTEDELREALRREVGVDRRFTLSQIRNIPAVRALVAPVDIQAITFDTGSAAIKADQAQALASLGRVIADSVRQNPSEIYMIEGHTDTVGSGAMNLALSDRRAESVALALTEFFGVPPENMVVQGYGEQFLKVPQEGDIRSNRRASVRRITDLLARN